MTRKVRLQTARLNYRIRPELDKALIRYVRAKGQTRFSILSEIIEKYMSCEALIEKLKKPICKEPFLQKKDLSGWIRKLDYVLPSHYKKIKFITAKYGIGNSEVMDNILESYLSKVNPDEMIEKAFEKIFG